MYNRNIRLTFLELTKDDSALLNLVSDVYAYENGKRTDKRIATKYTMVLPKCGFDTLDIKVKEDSPSITMEEIEAAGGTLKVKPIGFVATFYVTKTNQVGISAHAERMEVIK